jgi:hypothetical protein
MADQDDTNETTEEFEADDLIEEEVEEEPEVELDEEDLVDDDDIIDPDLDVDDDVVVDDDAVVDDDEDDAVTDTPRTRRKKRDDDDDDDDDELIADDDVEADLDKILKDRMVAVEDDDDEDEDDEVDVRGDGAERLMPKQQDEQLCPSCLLLVRAAAPNCPVGDDDCPIFS